MSRKNIQHLKIVKAENNLDKTSNSFLTAEDIVVKDTYSKKDIKDFDHLGFVAGIAPNLRGPIARCMFADLGLSANTPDFQQPKRAMHSTDAILLQARKDFLSLSI